MTILNPVKAGEALSATKENQKIQTINELSERLDTLHIPSNRSNGIVCTIENNTGATITTGSPIAVTGIRNEETKENLLKLYHKSGIQLTGNAVSATSTVIAFALESAKNGKLARCFLPGCFGGLITIKADNHKYAKPKQNGIESTAYGPFHLIGKSTRPTNISSDSDYDGFGILQYNLIGGHIIGVTQTTINGGQHTDVTVGSLIISSVSCPLLRTGESISAGSVVVMSWNPLVGEMQIIEAQCEGDAE